MSDGKGENASLQSEFFRLRVRPWGILTAGGLLAVFGTIAGFIGKYAWWLDLGSHFRVQYAVFFHSKEIEIGARRVGSGVGSDHYPVIVDFATRK